MLSEPALIKGGGCSDPGMSAFHRRPGERGKPHRVAVTAVMGGRVVTANALLRDRRMWEDRTASAAG